jgi:hypothetical protein
VHAWAALRVSEIAGDRDYEFPRMRGRRIEEEPVVLDFLPLVSLIAGQPKDPLLEDRIAPIPERQCEAQRLAVVAHPGKPVLVSTVHAGTRMIMREEVPRLAGRAVVLASGPLPTLAQIWPPVPPRGPPARHLQQPLTPCTHALSVLQSALALLKSDSRD